MDANTKAEMTKTLELRKVMAASLKKAGHEVPDSLTKEITTIQDKLGIKDSKQTSEQTNTRTNTQKTTNKQTNNQSHKQTNKHTTNKQTNRHADN